MPAYPSGHDAPPTWSLGMDGIAYGGDYNPEQWPEEVWAQDVDLMREAGVNLVSVGIFSWALLEPREGVFEFDWLDRLLTLLHSAGIRVDLATPTASPPAWFFATYPDARVVTRDGTALGFGSRGMGGPSSPAYRRASVRVASELARRYGRHPAVAMWHVHNEYGAPVAEDYSPTSAAAFRSWLQERYATLDALNTAWGTAFWGQRYGDWAHVDVPSAAPSVSNPSQRLDFARFTDHALRTCFIAERDAIREFSDLPITTNFMVAACPATDLWAWAREVDIVSNDHYLTAADEAAHIGLAMTADLTRSLAGGRPWMLMEHSTSAVNWQPRNVAKRPGEMARNDFSHLGRGADAILYFQWRASRSGAEKFHSAMIPHAGTTSRVWREVCGVGADLAKVSELKGSSVHADVAILWDWESHWAQDLDWRPSIDLDPRERVRAFYERLWLDGVTVDFAHPSADLSRYRLVIAPSSYLLTVEQGQRLTRYVAEGGTLLVSYFSAIVDQTDTVHVGGYGAPLRSALGVTVEEFLPLREGSRIQVEMDGTTVVGEVWAEDVTLEGADVIGTYEDGPAAGLPAVTRNVHGDGVGWYVSTRLAADALTPLLRPVYADAGVRPAPLPEDVEVMRREADGVDYLVAINHGLESVSIPADGTSLLTGEPADGSFKLAGGGVDVIRSRRRVPAGTDTSTRAVPAQEEMGRRDALKESNR